ncbi:MAG: hypothetical protein VKJ06_04720 [Vampirovibrionales bacterium]|nr:hypothetical protein [Vampirovibrionales bacterium]
MSNLANGAPAPPAVPFYKAGWFEWSLILGYLAVAIWLLADCKVSPQAGQIFGTARMTDPGHLIGVAQHMVSAKSLAALPNSLVQVSGQAPPLVPTCLAALMLISGKSTLAQLSPFIFWANITCLTGSIVFAYRLLTRWLPQPMPLAVSGLFALAPITLLEACQLGLTLPFLALSSFALWLTEKRLTKGTASSKWSLAGCMLWAVAAAYCHPVGIAVLLACITTVFIRQNKAAGFYCVLLSLACLSPVLVLYAWQLAHTTHGPFSQLQGLPPGSVKSFSDALRHGHVWANHALTATLSPAYAGRSSMGWLNGVHYADAAHSPWLQLSIAYEQATRWLLNASGVRWALITFATLGVFSKLRSNGASISLFLILLLAGVMAFGLSQVVIDDYALWPWLLAACMAGMLTVTQLLRKLKFPDLGLTPLWCLWGFILLGHVLTYLDYGRYLMAYLAGPTK